MCNSKSCPSLTSWSLQYVEWVAGILKNDDRDHSQVIGLAGPLCPGHGIFHVVRKQLVIPAILRHGELVGAVAVLVEDEYWKPASDETP